MIHSRTNRNTGTAEWTATLHTLHYKITVKEYLDGSWSDWFDSLKITHAKDGATTLAGAVRDQTALYGLIARVRDLGLTLVDVVPYSPFGSSEASE